MRLSTWTPAAAPSPGAKSSWAGSSGLMTNRFTSLPYTGRPIASYTGRADTSEEAGSLSRPLVAPICSSS